jgi:hypothetical protein
MFHRWAALVLVLALCAMSPKNAAGQTQSQKPRGHSAGGGIGNNYPNNPFNPDTYIPFTVGDSSCAGASEQHDVTVRIVNILGQTVVFPILYGASSTSTTSLPSALNGRPITHVALSCGNYVAYWNGKISPSGREAASGVYLVQLLVDNRPAGTKKIFYAK